MLATADDDQPGNRFWDALDHLASEARHGQSRYRKVLAEVNFEDAQGLGTGEPRPGAKATQPKTKVARRHRKMGGAHY
eukprot:12381025-Alexandrium_andersonii.AAC.1